VAGRAGRRRPCGVDALVLALPTLFDPADDGLCACSGTVALGATTEPPNDVGFERYEQRGVRAAKAALEALGIGYGRPGARPGRFYEYPGNPLANGTGLPLKSRTPA
jgi:hypothetical protein